MKLLSKTQILDDTNRQRKIEIDQGVQLAKKVDNLRELLATLERQHCDFISFSVLERTKKLGLLDSEINDKEKLLEKLEDKRKILLKPLDDEWTQLKQKQKEHIANIEALSLKQNELSKKEKEISLEQKRLQRDKEIIEDTKRDANTKIENVKRMEYDIEQYLKTIKTEREEAQRNYLQASNMLSKQEIENNNWAQALNKREKLLKDKEKELIDKERAITDKYNTLIRTINRTK